MNKVFLPPHPAFCAARIAAVFRHRSVHLFATALAAVIVCIGCTVSPENSPQSNLLTEQSSQVGTAAAKKYSSGISSTTDQINSVTSDPEALARRAVEDAFVAITRQYLQLKKRTMIDESNVQDFKIFLNALMKTRGLLEKDSHGQDIAIEILLPTRSNPRTNNTHSKTTGNPTIQAFVGNNTGSPVSGPSEVRLFDDEITDGASVSVGFQWLGSLSCSWDNYIFLHASSRHTTYGGYWGSNLTGWSYINALVFPGDEFNGKVYYNRCVESSGTDLYYHLTPVKAGSASGGQ